MALNLMKGSFGAKYKPVAKKVNPVSTWDPESIVPTYQPIEIGRLNELPVRPVKLEALQYMERLTMSRTVAQPPVM